MFALWHMFFMHLIIAQFVLLMRSRNNVRSLRLEAFTNAKVDLQRYIFNPEEMNQFVEHQ